MPELLTIRRVLLGLAIVLLFCAVKNYIAFLARGSAWCPYLCPSSFGWHVLDDAPLGLRQLFAAQRWLLLSSRDLIDQVFVAPAGLITRLVAAPVIEEIIYRGPMYLTRRYASRPLWWLFGIILVLLFALSHGRSGIGMLPLLVLGAYNLWLVAATRRLWPAVMLHFLYNFFFASMPLYQSLWASD